MSDTSKQWTGHSDAPETSALEYFIPRKLQPDFGKLTGFFASFVTENRLHRYAQVAARRSRKVLAVFEDTHHPHNISAVLRSLDAFGFQESIFLYEEDLPKYRFSDSVERGASQWLLIRRANSIEHTARLLKQNGYRIALVSLPDFAITSKFYLKGLPSFGADEFSDEKFKHFLEDKRLALIFGNEKKGVSKKWIPFADLYVHVPMFGFVESLNVSVCAGILFQSLRQSFNGQPGLSLSREEQTLLVESWVAGNTARAREIVARDHKSLLEYFDFVRSGGFFSPFS